MLPPLNNRRILIAEDERNLRMLLRVILESAGATVVEADDGDQALRLLELDLEGFDAVLTDLSMPRMDGQTLIRTAHLRWPGMVWVVCSALANQLERDVVEIVGGVVAKPFVPSQLVRAVADAFSQQPESAAV
jgi:CheY-like chemotaxis protein